MAFALTLPSLPKRYQPAAIWALYVIAVLVIVYALARFWDARDGNRFLTVGLKRSKRLLHPRCSAPVAH